MGELSNKSFKRHGILYRISLILDYSVAKDILCDVLLS